LEIYFSELTHTQRAKATHNKFHDSELTLQSYIDQVYREH